MTCINSVQSYLIIEELYRWGVRHVCIAPGSRSTPLTVAAVQHQKLILHRHFDERGLGFFALGIARSVPAPVAVITTSGTAVANLYPAVVEAHQSGVPLIILSADRPPRLQNCGANQSIWQRNIFGAFVGSSTTFEPPAAFFSVRALLSELDQALEPLARPFADVVHLNIMFDEPLYPKSLVLTESDLNLHGIEGWYHSPLPLTKMQEPAALAAESPTGDFPCDAELHNATEADWLAFSDRNGLVVLGAQNDPSEARCAVKLAKLLDWPLVTDIQSQARTGGDSVGLSDLLLLSGQGKLCLSRFNALLQIGGRFVSKRLQTYIDSNPWEIFWHVHPGDYPLNPGRPADRFYAMSVAKFYQAVSCRGDQQKTVSAAAKMLHHLNESLAIALSQRMLMTNCLSESAAVYQLSTNLPEKCNLFIGNSLSIRLFDQLSAKLPESCRFFANRGASGIDGLLATACGIASASKKLTIVVLGDTSLLHDLNSLHLLRNTHAPLMVVVLNNDGGGIFHHLPVPDESMRRDYYQMPHGYAFSQAAAMFGIAYAAPQTLEQFVALVQGLEQQAMPLLIEVKTAAEESFADSQDRVSWMQTFELTTKEPATPEQIKKDRQNI